MASHCRPREQFRRKRLGLAPWHVPKHFGRLQRLIKRDAGMIALYPRDPRANPQVLPAESYAGIFGKVLGAFDESSVAGQVAQLHLVHGTAEFDRCREEYRRATRAPRLIDAAF